MAKPIALAADHGGFELKEAVKVHLEELGLEYIDYGTHSTASVDYPDMALPACDAVVKGECSKALLFCGTGVGIMRAPAPAQAGHRLRKGPPASSASSSRPTIPRSLP